jgi:hypothetical protein
MIKFADLDYRTLRALTNEFWIERRNGTLPPDVETLEDYYNDYISTVGEIPV